MSATKELNDLYIEHLKMREEYRLSIIEVCDINKSDELERKWKAAVIDGNNLSTERKLEMLKRLLSSDTEILNIHRQRMFDQQMLYKSSQNIKNTNPKLVQLIEKTLNMSLTKQ